MLRVYFKCISAVFSPSEENALELLKEHVISQERSVPWSIPDATAKFTIEFCSTESKYEENTIRESHKDITSGRKTGDRIPELDKGTERLDAALKYGTLARAAQSMPKLESLVVNLDQEWRDDTSELEYCEEDQSFASSGLQLRLELLQTVRESVAAIFTTLEAPNINTGTSHLSLLTYLRLSLPCAYDFIYVSSCMPNTVAVRFRHLHLEIVDGTGHGGDLSYTRSWLGNGNPFDGDNCHTFSNLQMQYPNTEYMQDMYSSVNRCKNFESLGLIGTQCINMEGLKWEPAEGAGLKYMFLPGCRNCRTALEPACLGT
ncbi:hypothetical protein PMIN06_002114 [Paraphaeosphaeria minitans]|uniref:Uncharacterized protein n=1 Tax=Paraphaeosphaeria minitans TaxID=565426 RepID=A0A9P6GDF5_9PLEO|nr:hypothetical protein PMIN01_09193 [Paraphaeosphaeria minitans]